MYRSFRNLVVVNLAATTLAIVVVVSWISIVFYPSATDFMRGNPLWNGLRDFNDRFGVEEVYDLRGLEPRPEGSVFVVLPYLPYHDRDLRRMNSFVRQGGTLLLLDDYGYGNQVLEALGLAIRFEGQPLLDPYVSYRNQWLPVAVDLAPELKKAGIRQLVLNHATALSVSQADEVLARSSDMAFLDKNDNRSWDEGEARGNLAVAARATVDRGTVIAVADPSILINSMLGRGDNEAFIRQLMATAGDNPRLILDKAHLARRPLDTSKDVLEVVRQGMAVPHVQALVVGLALFATFLPARRKGDQTEYEH